MAAMFLEQPRRILAFIYLDQNKVSLIAWTQHGRGISMLRIHCFDNHKAVSEGHGEAALMLLKAGVESGGRDVDGCLAIQLAPDPKVDGKLII